MTLVCHHNSPLHSVDVLQVVSNSLKCCHHYLHSPEPRLVQSSVLGVLVVAKVTETTRYQPIRLILCCDNQSEISIIVLYCVNQLDMSIYLKTPHLSSSSSQFAITDPGQTISEGVTLT